MKRYTDSTKPQSRCTSPGTECLLSHDHTQRQLTIALLQLEEARQIITKLRNDKAALKSALADTVRKRNHLYTELTSVWTQLDAETVKNQNLAEELQTLRRTVAKRDSFIRGLEASATCQPELTHAVYELTQKAKRSAVMCLDDTQIQELAEQTDVQELAVKLARLAQRLIDRTDNGPDQMQRVSKLTQDISAAIRRSRDLVFGLDQDTIVTASHDSSFADFLQTRVC